MSVHIDLATLHNISRRDRRVESELIQLFLEDVEDCLTLLRHSCAPEFRDLWREQAHALRGISANFGAQELARLSECALNKINGDYEQKITLFRELDGEYRNVKKLLRGR